MTTTIARRNGVETLLEEPPVTLTREDFDELFAPPEPSNEAVSAEPPPVGEEAPHLALFFAGETESELGRHAARTARALAQRGAQVHLFARHDFLPETRGVTVHALGYGTDANLVDAAHDFARRACNAFLSRFESSATPVTLLGYEWSSAPTLSILRGVKNLGGILALHSLERQRSDLSSELSQRIEAIEASALREVRTILTLEPAVAEVARHWQPECALRLTAARQPFPAHRFEAALDPGAIKARYQIGPLDPTILFIGDLSTAYGPDILVKALPAVLRNHPHARLVVVGDGDLAWPLRVYARYLLLEHAVRLVGHVEGQAMCELVQAADMVVVPSRESTPWWPIQAAWAAGKPVVVTHPAAPQLIEHEQDGVLVYPHESSLVWGLERVLNDGELRGNLATKGRAKLEERNGWCVVAEQIEELMGVGAAR